MTTNQSAQTSSKDEIIPEDPNVVKGGPLDPTSAEGTPPEGLLTGGDGITPLSPMEPSFYTSSLRGNIKTPEDAKNYIKTLEDMAVQAAAEKMAKQNQNLAPAPELTQKNEPTITTNSSPKDRFKEVIYSNPDEAFELAVEEANRRMDVKNAAERHKEEFWKEFYSKNPDLRGKEKVVNLILKERSSEVSLLKTKEECVDFISRNSRELVKEIRKDSGVTETQVSSGKAVALGGSREPVPTPQVRPSQPQNFIDQLKNSRPKKK